MIPGLLAAVALACQATNAAVITNPTLVSGASANLFDPSGSEDVDIDGSGATSQSTIEAMTTARSLQSFSGFATSNSGAGGWLNYVSFTDPLRPDIRFTASGSSWRNGSTGQQSTTASQSTSGSSNLRMIGNNNTSVPLVFRIDFGNYNTDDTTFDANTNAVSAAGVTLSNLVLGISANVSFYTDAGVLLSSQSVTGNNGDTTTTGGIDAYFGYQSTFANIGYMLVTKTATDASKSATDVGLDDLVFTTVPEPAVLGALSTLALLGVRRRR